MNDTHTLAIRRASLALRLGLGFIWVYEGLVPKLLMPLTSFELDVVAASGVIPNSLRPLVGESPEAMLIRVLGVLEIVLGALVLAGKWTRPLCVVQGVLVAFFTVVIPLTSAEILGHPFGLLTKNIPILGAIIALWWLQLDADAPSGRL